MGKRKTIEEFITELSTINPNITIEGPYVNNRTKVLCHCKKCGYSWYATPHNLLSGHGCIVCAKKKKRTANEFAEEMSRINPNIIVLGGYDGLDKKIKVQCTVCGTVWEARPHNLLKGSGCPVCAHQKTGERTRKTQTQFVKELALINPDISVIGEYTNSNTPISVKCNLCGHKWKAAPSNLIKGSGCPKCNYYLKTSFPEQTVYYYVRQAYPDAINGYTDIFDNKMELDIYIPSKHTGIEYDGSAWHNDEASFRREKKKYDICRKNGIYLIRIRENSSDKRTDISDITLYKHGTLEEVLEELRAYIDLPIDIDVNRDAKAIKTQYYGIVNIVQTTEHFKNQLLEIDSSIEVLGDYINSMTPIEVRCKKCNNKWFATPNGLLAGHGCARCKRAAVVEKRTKSTEDFARELALLNPTIEVLGEYKGSRIKIRVRCKKCRRVWDATPSNLLKGSGCINCSGYSNTRKSTDEFKEELKRISPEIIIKSDYIAANKTIVAQCKKCGYEWETTPSKLLRGQKCPRDNNTLPKTTESFKRDLKAINPSIEVLGEYVTSKTPIRVKCSVCGHEWKTTPNSLLNKHGCPNCYGKKKRTTEEFIEKLKSVNTNVIVLGTYVNTTTPILVKCALCGYEWLARPYHLLNGHGCPVEGKSLKKTTEQFKEELLSVNRNIEVLGEYINSKTKIAVKCKTCGFEWSSIPNSLLRGHGCPQCARQQRRK